MRKGGIKIWGSAVAITVVAAGGFIAKNIFNTNGSVNQGTGTSVNAGSGSTILINPSTPTPTPTIAEAPLPTSPPSSVTNKLEVECENIGASVFSYTKLISITNNVEEPKSRFYLNRGINRAAICKIIKNSGELYLSYGLTDKSVLSRVSLNVYVDGVLKRAIDISRGQVLREKIDISKANGYKLEFSVPEHITSGDFIYILSK